MTTSTVSTSLEAIRQALTRIGERAERISQFGQSADAEALVDDIVGIKSDQQAVAANAKVIKAEQSLTDSLLDIIA